jgi:glycopeptide antibiotics resistance protein
MNWIIEVFLFLVIPTSVIYLIIRLFFVKKYKFQVFIEIIRLISIAYLYYLIYIVWLKPTATMDYLPLNLIPLKTIIIYLVQMLNGDLSLFIVGINIIGNIILCLPIGVLLPLIIKNITLKKVLLIAVIIPLIIEVVQLCLHLSNLGTRSIDVDDIILNFLGIIIGYYICRYLNFLNNFNKIKSNKSML